MPSIIATFQALPFSAFSNRPGGANDSHFTVSDNDPSQLLTVTIYDDDPLIDGDTAQDETADDTTQYAVITDSEGNVVATDVIYVEWTATYASEDGQEIDMWRFETEDNIKLFAVSDMPEERVNYYQQEKEMHPTGMNPDDIPQVPCLCEGTLITTQTGPRHIETLSVGERVITAEHGGQRIRWIGKRRITAEELRRYPALRPVCIVAGALGNGLPKRDMQVSRQHRMLVQSQIAKTMFGHDEVLVPAIKLTALPGIYLDQSLSEVTYFHLLLDAHQIIFAEGAPTETLFTGREALQSIPRAAQDEILSIFPALGVPGYVPQPARFIPPNRKQHKLIARHLSHQRPMLGPLRHHG